MITGTRPSSFAPTSAGLGVTGADGVGAAGDGED